MEMVNFLYANVEAFRATPKGDKAVSGAVSSLLTVLSPIAPHLCEELWQGMPYAAAPAAATSTAGSGAWQAGPRNTAVGAAAANTSR